jgi:hypothetical protein
MTWGQFSLICRGNDLDFVLFSFTQEWALHYFSYSDDLRDKRFKIILMLFHNSELITTWQGSVSIPLLCVYRVQRPNYEALFGTLLYF